MTTSYKIGYADGYARNDAWALENADYELGYFDGLADSPSLDELTLDVAKERRDPLGY